MTPAMAPRTASSAAGPPDVPVPVVITIDGPAGTGKSTVARRLAARLGLDHLDTGAMYRAAALLALERELDPDDGPAIAAALRETGIDFDWAHDPPRLQLGGRDVGDRIRDLDVSTVVSRVAAQPPVRAVLTEWQRTIGRAHPRLVTEGRDQGSTVFPDAAVRFYLDADTEVRADRRARQMAESGRAVDLQAVRDDIRRRDELDRERSDSPLVRPEGAVVVDTGDRTVDEVVDEMAAAVEAAVPELRAGRSAGEPGRERRP
jgi:cytidylate kinase